MMYENEKIEIIQTCRLMQDLGFFIGTWGNISTRAGNHIILTPSRVNYDTMTPEDMVVIDLDGNKVEGTRNPTSEKEVHRQIYLARSDVQAVIHAHTENAMALSATNLMQIPCIVEEMSQLLGGAMPLTRQYVPAEQHALLGEVAARTIGDKSAVLLKNHGPVACGRSLEEAVLVTKVVEKCCSMYLKLANYVKIEEIPARYVKSERYRFLFTYGKEKT